MDAWAWLVKLRIPNTTNLVCKCLNLVYNYKVKFEKKNLKEKGKKQKLITKSSLIFYIFLLVISIWTRTFLYIESWNIAQVYFIFWSKELKQAFAKLSFSYSPINWFACNSKISLSWQLWYTHHVWYDMPTITRNIYI